MKLLAFAIVILFCFILYACVVAGARADEQSQQLFQKRKNEKFEKE